MVWWYKKMNVFTDFMHPDLYHSLHLLFEERSGASLFRPIKENPNDWDGLIPLIRYPENPPAFKYELIDGIRYDYVKTGLKNSRECYIVLKNSRCYTYQNHTQKEITFDECLKMEEDYQYYIQKVITFKKFLEMDIDVILTNYFGHEQTFYELVKKYKPNAIFIRYIYCMGEHPLGYAKNILHTAHERPKDWDSTLNYLKYFPESRKEFCYVPPTNHNVIKSFFNYLTDVPEELNNWNKYKSTLKEFIFRMYGINIDLIYDGYVPYLSMPKAMQEASFIWHPKPWGGGGYNAMQAILSGRPLITRRKYLQQWNEILLGFIQDSINCIDLDMRSFEENINLIREWSEPSRHLEICKQVVKDYNRFVNHERQAEEVKTFLANARKGV